MSKKFKERMNNLLKRVSLSGLMMVTVVTLAFGSFVPNASAALATGDLVKGPNSDAVYYINGSTKHVFPDRKTYLSWYANFNGVKTVAVSELDMYTTGSPVAYRPGTKMVTHPNTNRVYAVEPNGSLRWIPSETVANTLYGANWAKMVNDVHELTFGNYTIGTDMAATAHPKGTLLQKTGEGTVYYYDGTNIRPFATSAAFDANNFNWNNVVKVSSLSGYTTGSSITGAESFATISGSGMSTTTPTAPAGTLTVALSPATPASGIVIGGAARVPFTTVRLTAGSNPVTVDALTIERVGVAQDAPFTDFDLLDASTMLPLNSSSKSLNSAHQATFNDNFVVAANSSKDVIVAANMDSGALSSYAGEVPMISVTAITLVNSTLSGTLPITGNYQTINGTVTVGTATVASGANNPTANTEKEIGTKDFIVTSFKITNNSSETSQVLKVKAVTFTNNGSSDPSDVENLELVNTNTGAIIATVAAPTSDEVSFNNLNIDIAKGNSLNLDLRLDIKNGSTRTISYDIDEKQDLVVFDTLRGFNVVPTFTATSAPYYGANDVTIGNGSLRVESVALTNTNITENKTGVLLGKFKFVGAGEAVNITRMGVNVTLTTTTNSVANNTDITNITIKNPAGTSVLGPTDPTWNSGTILTGVWQATATSSDTLTVPVGETVYSVYGDLSSDFSAGDRVQVGIFPAIMTAKGDVSGRTITPTPSGNIQSTQVTIKSADLNVSVANSPSAQTIVAGSQDFEVANLVFDASDSGSDVRVTQVAVPIITTGAAYPDILTGLQLFVGTTEIPVDSRSSTYSTSGTTAAGSGTTTLTISSGNLTIPAGGSKTVRVLGDVGTGATSGTFKVGIQTNGVTAIDSESQTISEDITAGQGQAMTLSTGGTLNIALAQDPAAALVVAGTTINVGQFTAQAKNEAMLINSMGFEIVNPDGGIVGDKDEVESLELWESGGAAALGTISVNASRATITPSSGISLGVNAQKTYIVKAKFRSVDAPSVATSGSGVEVKLSYIDVDGTSAGSSSVSVAGIGDDFKTFTVFKSVPSVTVLPVTDKITGNQETTLFKFSVTANSAGPIAVAKFTFGVNTTTVHLATTTMQLYVSDSSSTQGTKLAHDADIWVYTAAVTGEGRTMLVESTFDVNDDATVGMRKTGDAVARDKGEHLIINAGATKYFTLRGSLTGHDGTTSNETISTVLAGDASFAGTGNLNMGGIDGLDQDDFIWSDLNFDLYSTTTATETVGWFNGYRVSGLDSATSTATVVSD